MHMLRRPILSNAICLLVAVAGLGLCICVCSPFWGGLIVMGAVPTAVVYLFGSFRFLKGMMQGRLRNRPPMTDEQFFERYYLSQDAEAEVVMPLHELVATRFREVGGDRLWPSDRLDDILRLVADPRTRLEALLGDITARFDLSRDDLANERWDTIDDMIWSVQRVVDRRLRVARGRRMLPSGSGPQGD